MWWYYEKISETSDVVLYAYSRENRNLDGRIKIDKKTGEAQMIQPSVEDVDGEFAQKAACRKTYHLMKENFPDNRMIACG